MRGKVADTLCAMSLMGITPAYAGKRIKLRKRHRICGDHPRVCGEKPFSQLDSTVPPGSPPRVRGKDIRNAGKKPPLRITPACAGKSIRPSSMASVPWDHPRACGEKSSLFRTACSPMGSPPRMRGKALELFGGAVVDGITPACAGKSWAHLHAQTLC